jgi:CheY-like chemotaxis protein
MTRRVLIIDDDATIREITAITLTHVAGYEVSSAASGAEGVASAQADAPDAILLDVMMPGMDGPSTLEQLRGDVTTCDVPVVFLTAKVQPSERARLEGLGVRGVIAKPFDAMQLVGDLNRLLAW